MLKYEGNAVTENRWYLPLRKYVNQSGSLHN